MPRTRTITLQLSTVELNALMDALVTAGGEDEGRYPWTRDDAIRSQARQRIWRKIREAKTTTKEQ